MFMDFLSSSFSSSFNSISVGHAADGDKKRSKKRLYCYFEYMYLKNYYYQTFENEPFHSCSM